MEENKYYTPGIDEFFVGFEFEELFKQKWNRLIPPPKDLPNEWVKLKLDTSHSISRIISKIKQDKVRVKHLDKEDLIELGFEEDSFWNRESVDNPDKSYSMGNNRHIVIRHEFNKGKYCIYDYSRKINDQRLFEGYVKNKSELIKVLKMLGIK